MLKCYNDPLLLDFLKLALAMPQDEREQVEALTGMKYDIDAVAIGNFTVPGPKYVMKGADDIVLCAGGFKQQRPGVWRDYMLTSPQAWEREYYFQVTRWCRRAMDHMFASGQAHRLECLTPLKRIEARPELVRWYSFLGYRQEGIRRGYCADGSDVVAFSRVKHGHRE